MQLSTQQKKKTRGSALIITVMLISVLATVSFTVATLTISDFRKVAALQDSIAAYYAAEAGIEHGLMQYRLFHNAEISKEFYDSLHQGQVLPNAQSPTELSGQPQSFRLDGSSTSPKFLTAADDKGSAWYDLKMWYKGYYLGEVAEGIQPNPVVGDRSPVLSKDSALQLTVPPEARSMVIEWVPNNPNQLKRPPDFLFAHFLELFVNGEDGDYRTIQHDEDIVLNPSDTWAPNLSSPFQNIMPQTVRIKPWDMASAKLSLVFRDGLNGSGSNVLLDQQVTSIEAIGNVGKAKRELRINVNRATGTILESEDFLFYSGDEPIVFD